MIGRRVRKFFPGHSGAFRGVVARVEDEVYGGVLQGRVYIIEYEDGDNEGVVIEDLLPLLEAQLGRRQKDGEQTREGDYCEDCAVWARPGRLCSRSVFRIKSSFYGGFV
jgi:hypothetical protein